MSSVVEGRGPAAEVHGGLLWGTWVCACQAGGSAWSAAAADKALRRHALEVHADGPVPQPRQGDPDRA